MNTKQIRIELDNINVKQNKMNKRFTIELGLFLYEYAKNNFDCDGYDLLPERNKEWIRNEIINKMDQLLKL